MSATQDSLFESANGPLIPLAERMRPERLDEYAGQSHLIYPGSFLWNAIEKDQIPSMIFWGPPGVGKTTLAKIIAQSSKARFVSLSATKSGVKEVRQVMEEAAKAHAQGQKTILFIDEIHRFNKSQQDAFLPYVENGTVILIGATTENPSFELNNALLSRAQTLVLKALEDQDIEKLLQRALSSQKGLGDLNIRLEDGVLSLIASYAHGDARLALSSLERAVFQGREELDGIHIDKEVLKQVLQKRSLLYDKKGEQHFDLISALHKSMRNSDVQACIYWLARMLEGGEDPLYIARRIVRMASEDIGMADSRALQIAVAAYQACQFLGMPECSVHLTHAITYLALAPKSNALETAYFAARDDAYRTMDQQVPLHLRNAPTSLMKDLGYGNGYEYSHDYKYRMTDMECLPPALLNKKYYQPTSQGSEAKVAQRLEQIESIKRMVRAEKQDKKHERNQRPNPGTDSKTG